MQEANEILDDYLGPNPTSDATSRVKGATATTTAGVGQSQYAEGEKDKQGPSQPAEGPGHQSSRNDPEYSPDAPERFKVFENPAIVNIFDQFDVLFEGFKTWKEASPEYPTGPNPRDNIKEPSPVSETRFNGTDLASLHGAMKAFGKHCEQPAIAAETCRSQDLRSPHTPAAASPPAGARSRN
ncbi:MAG: hypothetical protein AAF195_02840 [Pseudomonadota bacterium]